MQSFALGNGLHICRHWFCVTLLKIFNFQLCFSSDFINCPFRSLFWLPRVPIGSLFHKKLGPYWVPISKLGGPYKFNWQCSSNDSLTLIIRDIFDLMESQHFIFYSWFSLTLRYVVTTLLVVATLLLGKCHESFTFDLLVWHLHITLSRIKLKSLKRKRSRTFP